MTLATNPRAKFDYDIIKTYEAGIILLGHEVKSVRGGDVSLKGAYAAIHNGELWLLNAHIGAYKKAGKLKDYDSTHSRKLLLKKSEFNSLIGKLQAQRLTLVPISLYAKGRRLKVELGLARGKKQYEKRESIKKRETHREIEQALRRKS